MSKYTHPSDHRALTDFHKFKPFVWNLLWLLAFLGIQSCKQEVPNPVASSPTGKVISNSIVRGGTLIKREKRELQSKSDRQHKGSNPEKGKPDRNTAQTLVEAVCYDIVDVYYNKDTGEVLDVVYIDTVCDPVPGSGGSPGGGGPTPGGTPSGYSGVEFTEDTEDHILPADCSSWPFTSVGPSGYMACGVRGIKFDVLSQYMDEEAKWHIAYTYFVFDKPLYFEMPSRYSPGEAASICARLKDEAEHFVERKYGNTQTPSPSSAIEGVFYNKLSNLIQAFGGRLSRTANYSNTQIGDYGITFLPNNGDCY